MHLAMRRTLWLVDAAHMPTLQPAAAADRAADTEERRLVADVEKSGVCPDGRTWLDRAKAAVLGYLGEHPHAWLGGVRISPRFPSPLSKAVPG